MPTWRKSLPNDTTKLSDLPTIHSDNFSVTESAYGYEHYSPLSANATSGYHKLGYVGATYIGPTTSITGISTETGALAFDTTLGTFVYYTGSTWQRITQTAYSRMRAYRNANVAVTSAASAEILVYNTEDYDTLSEHNTTTGVFTALASGYYLVISSVGLVASATQLASSVVSATGQASASWTAVGAATNWQAIDEYPTASDTDYNITQTLSASDIFSGGVPDVPSGSTGIAIKVTFRASELSGSCVCNSTCYNESCTCDGTCYGHSCSCNNTCYGYSSCSCNSTCYQDDGYSCSCNLTCYGYTACSCNSTCYTQTCTCQVSYGTGACGCNLLCYAESETKPSALIRYNGIDYTTSQTTLASSFADYTAIWNTNPSNSTAWAYGDIANLSGFGYKATAASAGCSAQISQTYLTVTWSPLRPIFTVYLYKNSVAIEASQTPIIEAGAASYQTVKLVSIVKLDAGDTLDIRYTKTLENDTIYGNSAYTYLAIHRLGGHGF